MIEYEVIESSIGFYYMFSSVLPLLPLPTVSSSGFQTLAKELKPFGILASDISVESPTNNLGDLVMSINLRNGKLPIRISYDHFELSTSEVFQGGDFLVIERLTVAICNTLKSIYAEFDKGATKVTWRAHLAVDKSFFEKLANNYLSANAESIVQFVPSAINYKLKFGESEPIYNSRIAVATSDLYDNAVFIDCSIWYRTINEPVGALRRFFDGDLRDVMISLELKRKTHKDEESANG